MRRIALSPLFFLGILLVSCGYHLGNANPYCPHETVQIPYVEGDPQGGLTKALIQEFGQSGPLRYVAEGGQLTLNVCLLDHQNENVGFQYSTEDGRLLQDRRGQTVRKLVANEGRLMAKVCVELVETCSGRILLGPFEVEASADYDFDPNLTRSENLEFSLGQLDFVNAAEERAQWPLEKRLASEIISLIYKLGPQDEVSGNN